MATKIQKWGNSLAVRIPKEVARSLTLKEGSVVVVQEKGSTIVIKPAFPKAKKFTKTAWRKFVVPTGRKRENVSGNIDEIVYGKYR